MRRFDYLIVGAGFAGATLAYLLHKKGKRVLVVEKRSHIGGNCFDYYNEHGVLVHKYGPHYFRTNYPEVRVFLSQFTDWIPQKYRIRVSVGGRLYSFPINRTTLNEVFGVSLRTVKEAEAFLEKKRKQIIHPKNAEEQILATAGQEIYELFFKNYTKKQWGMDPRKLAPTVTARIPIRTNTDDRYTSASFQALPKAGYTRLFEKMLTDIPILLNTDYEDIKHAVNYDKLIYTGPIDTYFQYFYGKLPYRSLRFAFTTYKKEFFQDWVQVNYPNEHAYTRIVEIKHITKQKIGFTTISKEYPSDNGEPYYPVPNTENEKRYQQYVAKAKRMPDIYFIGRLAQYRYMNMDEVVKAALDLFPNL